MRGNEALIHSLLAYEKFLFSGGDDGYLRMWRIRSSESVQKLPIVGGGFMSGKEFIYSMGLVDVSHRQELEHSDSSPEAYVAVGTNAGDIILAPIHTSSKFLNVGIWKESARYNVSESGSTGAVPISSIVCAWDFIYIGTASGIVQTLRYELNIDPTNPKHVIITNLVLLQSVPIHGGPVVSLTFSGGVVFSASQDMSIIPFYEPENKRALLPGDFQQKIGDGQVIHNGSILSMVGNAFLLASGDESGKLVVRMPKSSEERMRLQTNGRRMSAKERKRGERMRVLSKRLETDATAVPIDAQVLVPTSDDKPPNFLANWSLELLQASDELGVKRSLHSFAPIDDLTPAVTVFNILGASVGIDLKSGRLQGDGMTVGEMEDALMSLDPRKIGGKLTRDKVDAMLKGLNPDGDTHVSLGEFSGWFNDLRDKSKDIEKKFTGRLFLGNLIDHYYPWFSLSSDDSETKQQVERRRGKRQSLSARKANLMKEQYYHHMDEEDEEDHEHVGLSMVVLGDREGDLTNMSYRNHKEWEEDEFEDWESDEELSSEEEDYEEKSDDDSSDGSSNESTMEDSSESDDDNSSGSSDSSDESSLEWISSSEDEEEEDSSSGDEELGSSDDESDDLL